MFMFKVPETQGPEQLIACPMEKQLCPGNQELELVKARLARPSLIPILPAPMGMTVTTAGSKKREG